MIFIYHSRVSVKQMVFQIFAPDTKYTLTNLMNDPNFNGRASQWPGSRRYWSPGRMWSCCPALLPLAASCAPSCAPSCAGGILPLPGQRQQQGPVCPLAHSCAAAVHVWSVKCGGMALVWTACCKSLPFRNIGQNSHLGWQFWTGRTEPLAVM